MPITSGLVAYETGRKSPEEYAPATKVRVEIGFTVLDGEDYQKLFSFARAEALIQAQHLLQGTVVEAIKTVTAENPKIKMDAPEKALATFDLNLGAKEAYAEKANAAEAVETKPKRGAGRPKKQEAEKPESAAPQAAPASVEPVKLDLGLSGNGSATPTQPPSKGNGLNLEDMVPGLVVPPVEEPKPAPVEEVTDNDLYAEVVKAMQKVRDPNKVRDLIAYHCSEYTDGIQPSLKRVPAHRRAQFVIDIKALS